MLESSLCCCRLGMFHVCDLCAVGMLLSDPGPEGPGSSGVGTLQAKRVALPEWNSKLICSLYCTLPLNLIREELVTGTYCWLRGVTCTQVYSSKMIAEGDGYCKVQGCLGCHGAKAVIWQQRMSSLCVKSFSACIVKL